MWVTFHHPPFISRIAATQTAFAAVLGDGTVFTWGDPDKGGDHRTLEVHGSAGIYIYIFPKRDNKFAPAKWMLRETTFILGLQIGCQPWGLLTFLLKVSGRVVTWEVPMFVFFWRRVITWQLLWK